MSWVPEQPSGWPRAMAPPLTLTFSMSGWCSFSHANTTDANASLISVRSIWSIVMPARSRTLGEADLFHLHAPPLEALGLGEDGTGEYHEGIAARQREGVEAGPRRQFPGS